MLLKLEATYDAQEKSIRLKEKLQFFEATLDTHPNQNTYRFSLRGSTIVEAFSYLEFELMRWYNIVIKRDSKKQIDKFDEYIIAFTEFIGRDVKIGDGNSDKLYQEITKIQKLRNIIVHSNSTIKSDNKLLKMFQQYSKGNFHLEDVVGNHYLMLNNQDFVLRCLDNMYTFTLQFISYTIDFLNNSEKDI